MTNRTLLLAALLPLVFSVPGSGQDGAKPGSTEAQGAKEFLARLAGDWDMSGRGWPARGAQPYRTASKMSARVGIGERALVRDIEAPAIGLEALDVLSYNPELGEYTYYYMSSTRSEPLVLRGTRGDGDEVRLVLEQDGRVQSRTVIRLTGPDEMVARDFLIDADGEEWMSREVFHWRLK